MHNKTYYDEVPMYDHNVKLSYDNTTRLLYNADEILDETIEIGDSTLVELHRQRTILNHANSKTTDIIGNLNKANNILNKMINTAKKYKYLTIVIVILLLAIIASVVFLILKK